jgi:hypothetical protein
MVLKSQIFAALENLETEVDVKACKRENITIPGRESRLL